MADAEIVVGIRGETEGGKIVKRTLDDIGASGKKAQQGTKDLENQFNSLNNAGRTLSNTMKGLVAAFGLRELQQTVDAYTNVQNRLKLVTANASELVGVTKELFVISNETRQSFTSTAEVYARTALATKDLGLSQRDTLEFTRSLNQAVILSGASAAESSAGLIQLSQGLASGALRGDELRSVLEQLPAVADVIAKSLGVTRGELRNMGQDGKITADIIIDAFRKAKDDLDNNFGKTVPTIAQSLTVLKNKIIEYIGELDRSTGASADVARALILIGNNIDTITKLLIVGVTWWGLWRAAMLLAVGSSAVAAVVGFTTAFIQLALEIKGVTALAGLLSAAFLSTAGVVAAFAAAGVAAYVFRDDIEKAVVAPLAEVVIWADKATAALTGLFGKPKTLTGLNPEDIRGGAQDIISGVLNPPTNAGTVSNVTGANLSGGNSGAAEALKEAKKAASDLKQVIADTSTEQETLLRRIKELEKLRSFAKTDEEVRAVDRALASANEQLKTASTTLPGVDSAMDRLIRQTDRFADSAADAFTDFVFGAKSAREALADLLRDMAKLFLQEGVTSPLSDLFRGAIRGGGGFGSIFGSIGRLFGFASGGSMVVGGNSGVDQNTLSLNGSPIANVGRGEVISVSPNSGGGGSVIVNQTINVSTGVVDTVRAEMVAMLPEFQQRTIAAVNEANLRGY